MGVDGCPVVDCSVGHRTPAMQTPMLTNIPALLPAHSASFDLRYFIGPDQPVLRYFIGPNQPRWAADSNNGSYLKIIRETMPMLRCSPTSLHCCRPIQRYLT